MAQGEEKTEKATPKKRKESRREGQVPRTQELGGWSALMLVALVLPLMLKHELTAIAELMKTCFSLPPDADVEDALALLGEGGTHILIALVSLGSAVMLIGVSAALAQGGFYLATKSMKPSLKKLDPIKGAKRIFGPQAWWEGAKMLLKSSIVAIMVYGSIRAMVPLIGGMVPIQAVLSEVNDQILALVRNVALAGLVMAVADYIIVRRRMGKQTRMTKHEVKQEHKQTEGDPQVKGQIRSRQLAAARNRMMADVPLADVVLVNPTHVAVALRYDPERGAPRVVARGAGEVARRIREEASTNRVPLVRDVPLARALYTSTTVGQEIPAELYAAVAQVLAFVLSRRNQGQRGGEHRSPRPPVELPPTAPGGRRRRTPDVNPSTPGLAGR